MSHSHTESSSFIEVAELEDDPEKGYVGFNAKVESGGPFSSCGVWIYHDDSINLEHAEKLVRALVEELDLPGIHVVEWATTCDKPLVESFRGGAFAVRKGRETAWLWAGEAVLGLADVAPPLDEEESDEAPPPGGHTKTDE